VAALILFAVPLYLWRRPRPESIPTADAAVVDAGATDAASPIVAFDAGPAGGINLSPFVTLRCINPGPGKTPPERCDHVTFFEDALARAIRESASCAPSPKTSYTVSYVMETDFRRKTLTLFAGKSSSLKRDKTKSLVRCVKRAMPTPDWATIPHQYVRYKVNVIATYPASETF